MITRFREKCPQRNGPQLLDSDLSFWIRVWANGQVKGHFSGSRRCDLCSCMVIVTRLWGAHVEMSSRSWTGICSTSKGREWEYRFWTREDMRGKWKTWEWISWPNERLSKTLRNHSYWKEKRPQNKGDAVEEKSVKMLEKGPRPQKPRQAVLSRRNWNTDERTDKQVTLDLATWCHCGPYPAVSGGWRDADQEEGAESQLASSSSTVFLTQASVHPGHSLRPWTSQELRNLRFWVWTPVSPHNLWDAVSILEKWKLILSCKPTARLVLWRLSTVGKRRLRAGSVMQGGRHETLHRRTGLPQLIRRRAGHYIFEFTWLFWSPMFLTKLQWLFMHMKKLVWTQKVEFGWKYNISIRWSCGNSLQLLIEH